MRRFFVRTTISVSVLALTWAAAGCVLFPVGLIRADEEFEVTADFVDVGEVRIEWRSGNVEVIVDEDAAELRATGTKFVSALRETDAEAALNDIEISTTTLESSPSIVVLTFEAPADGILRYSGNVRVVVPSSVRVLVELANGNADLEGFSDPAELLVSNGNVDIRDHTGDATVELANGNVDIRSNIGDVDVRANNGNIEIRSAPAENGSVQAVAEVGTVTVLVPADFAASLVLQSDLGNVRADLESFEVTDLVTRNREVRATLNGGGGRIRGETGLGDVEFESLVQ